MLEELWACLVAFEGRAFLTGVSELIFWYSWQIRCLLVKAFLLFRADVLLSKLCARQFIVPGESLAFSSFVLYFFINTSKQNCLAVPWDLKEMNTNQQIQTLMQWAFVVCVFALQIVTVFLWAVSSDDKCLNGEHTVRDRDWIGQ